LKLSITRIGHTFPLGIICYVNPNYITVVGIGNEDKHLARSITISSQFTDQKTVTIHLLKKNGHNAYVDNSNDFTVFVVPATILIHH
jgi:hypothetical protein